MATRVDPPIPSPTVSSNRCRFCGCTDLDCSRCVEATGSRCYWIEDDLCSACLGCAFVVQRELFRELLELLEVFGHDGRGATALAAFSRLKVETKRLRLEIPRAPETLEDFLGRAAERRGSVRGGPGVPVACPRCGIVDHRALSCDEARARVAGELVAGEDLVGLARVPDPCRAAGYVAGGRVRRAGPISLDTGEVGAVLGTIVSAARDEVLVRWDGDDRGLSPDAYSLSSATMILEVVE